MPFSEEPVIIENAFTFPIQYENNTGYHAAEMREVSDVVNHITETEKEFEHTITDDEPFSLDGYRNKEEVYGLVGEQHAESENNTVDSTGGTDHGTVDKHIDGAEGWIYIILPLKKVLPAAGDGFMEHIGRDEALIMVNHDGVDTHLYQTCKYATAYVIKQKTGASHRPLNYTAEHYQCKHIEKKMGEAAM